MREARDREDAGDEAVVIREPAAMRRAVAVAEGRRSCGWRIRGLVAGMACLAFLAFDAAIDTTAAEPWNSREPRAQEPRMEESRAPEAGERAVRGQETGEQEPGAQDVEEQEPGEQDPGEQQDPGSQEETGRQKTAKERLEQILSGEAELDAAAGPGTPGAGAGTPADPALPRPPAASLLDDETRAEYLAALRAYYAYHISGLRHRSSVFEWQLLSSRIIFVVVLLLVFAGIYFAAVQFHMGLRAIGKGAPDVPQTTELEAGAQGIKVSSPVLGVIILVISLAFFYLYLVYVYPIENIF